MKLNIDKYSMIALSIIIYSSVWSQTPVRIRVFDTVLFYDGYANLDTLIARGQVSQEAPNGVKRLSTSLYTKQLTQTQLEQIGDSMRAKVLVKASCDNYDRIGYIGLALVPKSKTSYTTKDTTVKRIELARFITPFMDKNKKPDTVPYYFDLHQLSSILRNKYLKNEYNFWMELMIFGVPYAANKEILGCSGRNDVFYGTVDLYTSAEPAELVDDHYLVPVSHHFYVNNYKAGATDSVGITQKTYAFSLPYQSENLNLHLITSNHGANTNGEEYNRRDHFIYIDDQEVLSYKPGEPTCEPYRKYNTQANGIYSGTVRTPAQWQSFSNWCPGAKIPNRDVNLGMMSRGKHYFRFSVPSAVFANKEGYFPLSVYLYGQMDSLKMSNAVINLEESFSIYPNPTTHYVTLELNDIATDGHYQLHNLNGQLVAQGRLERSSRQNINLGNLPSAQYLLKVHYNGLSLERPMVIQH